jgi:hypothetical protein
MADKIKLVAGDNRPFIVMTLMNPEDVPINITDATIVIYFREAGAADLIATIPCTINDPLGGVCYFNFPADTLKDLEGAYEGEIEITFANGDIQSVYDLLKFQVRAQVGPVG